MIYVTLSELIFTRINFRGFRGFWCFPRKESSRNTIKLLVRETKYAQNISKFPICENKSMQKRPKLYQ